MGRGGQNEKRRDFDRAAALKGGNGVAGRMGCGREHDCGIHGCRIAREAAELIEKLTDRCAHYAEEIAVLQEREKWVPVTERLPESAGDYLCWVKYYNMSTGNMEKEQRVGYFTPWGNVWGSDAVRGARATVLAWMPLPDGPEVE